MSGLNFSLFPLPRIGRLALMLVLVLALLGASLSNAQAQSRRRVGVAIGAGILGAIILNEAARGERRYQERYYRDDDPAPRRSYRRNRDEKRHSEPARKEKKVRSASRSKPKSAPPAEAAVAAKQPADGETVAPATEQAAATTSPQPDNSYLPQADQKAATRAAPKARDLPAVTNAAPAAPAEALPQDDVISTPDEIKAAQQHLSYMGYDVTATGRLDARTRSAFSAFQRSINAEATGILTYDQLQALFQKAASLAAKPR
jgi:hypothetical protein